jgi:phosphoglycolate phosphatase-like HAD superfamily hydrolase
MPMAITRDQYDAVLFDLDGVITDTANLHAACWKQMFDEYLQKRAAPRAAPSNITVEPPSGTPAVVNWKFGPKKPFGMLDMSPVGNVNPAALLLATSDRKL